jgi:hypothetical protein
MAKHSAPPSIWRGGDKSRMLTPAPPHHPRATAAGNQQASARRHPPLERRRTTARSPCPGSQDTAPTVPEAARTQPCRQPDSTNARTSSLSRANPGPTPTTTTGGRRQICRGRRLRSIPARDDAGARHHDGAAPELHQEPAAGLGHQRRRGGAARGPRAALTSILQRGGPRDQIPNLATLHVREVQYR